MSLRDAILALGLAWLAGPGAQAAGPQAGAFTRHVDPFIGTDGTGHVTPGATVPFGTVVPAADSADKPEHSPRTGPQRQRPLTLR